MDTERIHISKDIKNNGGSPEKIPPSTDLPTITEVSDQALDSSAEPDVVVCNQDTTAHEALLGDVTKDTHSADQSRCEQASRDAAPRGCVKRAGRWVRRNEYLVLILGSVTFLLGCVVLAVGVYLMQARGTCGHQTPPTTDKTVSPAPHHSPSPGGPTAGQTDNSTAVTADGGTVGTVDNPTDAPEPTNLALGRHARQSSTSRVGPQSYPANLAVDGRHDLVFSGGSCSRTDMESRPSWSVDLGSLETVKTVRLMIPRDVAAGELHNFEVRIGQESELELNPVCRHYMGTALIFSVTIVCERPMYGRYVSIQILGDTTRPHNRLTLCEVQVYNR